MWIDNRWQDAELYLIGVYTMVNEDPNYHARQEVMSVYRSAQDVQRRLVDLRKVADDSSRYLYEAYNNTTLVLNNLSHWLHELDKGPLTTTVEAEVVQLQLTEPESRSSKNE